MGKVRSTKSYLTALSYLVLFLVTILLVQYGNSGDVHAAERQLVSSELSGDLRAENDSSLANCRYGVTSAETESHAVSSLGAGVFYKFNQPYWYGALPENDAELMHMIKTRQKKSKGVYLDGWYPENVRLGDELADHIRDDPGAIWIVGNEVERGPNPGETWTARTGDMYPEVYAEAYHDVYHFIKGVDPTARVANAGLIQITPMRLQYLDQMWDAYQDKYGVDMPVDVWTMHAYVLPELTPDGQPNNIASAALGTDLALGKRLSGGDKAKCPDEMVYCYAEHDDVSILEDQVIAMRQWMKERGQQQKPLIVTEYSTLYHYVVEDNGKCGGLFDEFGNCFTPQRVSKFMLDSFDYFNNNARDPNLGLASDNNRLVQQWIWYGVWNWEIGSANLLQGWNSTRFTLMGESFRDHVHAEPTYVNLAIDGVKGTVISYEENDTVTARLSATVRNNGNVAVEKPFKVTFYSDEKLTQPIGSTTIDAKVRGCATEDIVSKIPWSGLPLGTYPFWVKVDSANQIEEDPKDNIGTGELRANGPVYTLDIEIVSDGIGKGGLVTRSPTEEAYEAGTVVTLTAVPYSGWTFEGWTGGLIGSNPTAELTIIDDTAVTAHFSQEHYTLEIDIVGEGDVKVYPSPVKAYYLYGDYLELHAVPANNWRFVGWTGDFEDAAPTVIFTFEGDVAATATFEQLLPEVNERVFLPITARAR